MGTAVNVQTMVFGNIGVAKPATGENEWLINAQGEDVVGIKNTVSFK